MKQSSRESIIELLFQRGAWTAAETPGVAQALIAFSLGLALNGLILLLVAWLVPGFGVGSFWQAVGAALLVSVLGFALNLIRRR